MRKIVLFILILVVIPSLYAKIVTLGNLNVDGMGPDSKYHEYYIELKDDDASDYYFIYIYTAGYKGVSQENEIVILTLKDSELNKLIRIIDSSMTYLELASLLNVETTSTIDTFNISVSEYVIDKNNSEYLYVNYDNIPIRVIIDYNPETENETIVVSPGLRDIVGECHNFKSLPNKLIQIPILMFMNEDIIKFQSLLMEKYY